MALTKDDILTKLSLAIEELDVPEWCGTVFIREMTAKERDAWESATFRDKDRPANIRAALAVVCLCDDKGARLFSDADADRIGSLSGAAVDRIFDACLRLCKLRKVDYEDARKN